MHEVNGALVSSPAPAPIGQETTLNRIKVRHGPKGNLYFYYEKKQVSFQASRQ